MIWAYRAIFWVPFIITFAVLLRLLYFQIAEGEIKIKDVRFSTIIVLVTFFVQLLGKFVYFYLTLKASPIGTYLLKDHAFLSRNAYSISQSFISNLLIGFIFTILGFLIFRIYKKPVFTKADLWVIFLVTFISGFPSVFIALIGGLLIMILVFIFISLVTKKPIERISPIPYLIAGTLIVGILNNFEFYLNFLRALKLI